MPAKRLWKRRLSARCKRFESFASVAFGEALRVKPMRCTNLGATGAKRTCREGRAVQLINDRDIKEIVNLWAGGSAAVKIDAGQALE